MELISKIRPGLRTIWWNPTLVEDAIFDKNGIPFCPTILGSCPKQIVTWPQAKSIYYQEIRNGNACFFSDAFVCFYIDDYKFDSKGGLWFSPDKAINILKHFRGIITPDFSTYSDFPKPLCLWNTYRMRAFGYYCGKKGLEVVNNVRGRTEDDFDYCFSGIETNSVIAIGTVGSGLKLIENREGFNCWIKEMVRILMPRTILVYGSSKYPIFEELSKAGIEIVSYEGETDHRFKGESLHE